MLGIDIETTGRAPERGYIINVGWELMDLKSDAVPRDPQAYYCGIPEMYRETGVPLADIHHIQWSDLEGKTPFRQDVKLQKELLKLMKRYPIMAHNAAFEDSWFMLHLPGYAEARRAGKIIVIDSRHICRSIDGEVRKPAELGAPARHARRGRERAAPGPRRHRPHAPHRSGGIQRQEHVQGVGAAPSNAAFIHSQLGPPMRPQHRFLVLGAYSSKCVGFIRKIRVARRRIKRFPSWRLRETYVYSTPPR